MGKPSKPKQTPPKRKPSEPTEAPLKRKPPKQALSKQASPKQASPKKSQAKKSLKTISAEVSECRACPRLVSWREKIADERRAAFKDETYWGRGVPGFGDANAKLVIMGLAPAAHGANRTGRMFTGDKSGEWLYRALWQAGLASQKESVSRNDGLKLHETYITAPVKCAPPQNKPMPDEKSNCLHFMEEELACLTEAKVFLALGQIAYTSLAGFFGVRPRPKFGHALEVGLEGPKKASHKFILCSYHVSQQNTFTGKLTEDMLRKIMERAKKLAGIERRGN